MASVGHIEPLAAVVRVGGPYGTDYTWAATLRYLSPTEVEIVGAVRAPTPAEAEAVKEVLLAAGVTVLHITRKKGAGRSRPYRLVERT